MELGIDLGSNSIGWAIVDKAEKRIIKTGTRIFQEGVENYGQGEREKSFNSKRRENRGKRKQFFRRKYRKKLLLKLLAIHGMTPVTLNELKNNQWQELVESEKMKDWFLINPYEYRAKAVEEKISLLELGRVLYHLSQRRGFQSNSRFGVEESGALFDGDRKNEAKTGKTGIIATEKAMEGKTLGQALNEIYPAENEPYKQTNERIRNRYTKRSMYSDEFSKIWNSQSQYHSVLTDNLKDKLGKIESDSEQNGILFYQRKLRSQKNLIGKCSFEPKKPRCPISAIEYEYFRAFQFINSVEVNGEALNKEERQIALDLLLSKEKPKISDLRKRINKEDAL
jgi:CRISPR-associated endonuclease Csn1